MPQILKPTTDLGLGNGATIVDYWAWAMSDLSDNANRGLLAEYLVGRALGCTFDQARQSWDEFDLKTPGGIRVEVKTTGRFQSWGNESEKPVFAGLRARVWNPDRNVFDGDPVVRADVFVFCHHHGRQPLCMREWEFYVISGPDIDALQQKSITLSRLRKLADAITYPDLREAVQRAIRLA